MHSNFVSILFLTGKFGAIKRETVESLVYTNKYSSVSANRTLAKMTNEYRLLKRLDRGKRKTDGYCLTHNGIKEYRRLFGLEPKVFSSLDKLSHSLKIGDFYCQLVSDMINRNLIDRYIIEEKKLTLIPHRQIDFMYKNKEKSVVSDAFCIYRYTDKKGIVFNLEIENSDRKSATIAKKTLDNYEGYFISEKWKDEKWQPKNTKIFPPTLIVAYSDFKAKEIMRWIRNKKKIDLSYYFTDYYSLEKHGFSAPIWYNIEGDKISIIN